MSVLREILARKRIDVAARKARGFLPSGRRTAGGAAAFREALAKPGARFILEAKRKSPSEGVLRTELRASDIKRAYEGVADAISVLTDEPFFGGNLEFFAEIRAAVQTPLLCKDFVVDPFQVREAAAYGANAILLMLSVLTDEEARACLAEAEQHDIATLVEVHDDRELRRALALPAAVIGINNRSFQDLSVDLAVTERLAGQVPTDRLLMTESGIRDHRDVRRLAPLVDGFLVGSSLMKSDNLASATRALVFGRVKICGATSLADVHAIAAAGASHVGLVLAKSVRLVARTTAESLAAASILPVVGVFKDHPLEDMLALAQGLDLHAVQIHGDESMDYTRTLRTQLAPACEIWRAVKVPADSTQSVTNLDDASATRLLFDSVGSQVGGNTVFGGTGQSYAMSRIAAHPRLHQSWIAGGLGVSTIGAASAVGGYGLDVSSSVEWDVGASSERGDGGRKSPDKMRQLIEALREPSRREETL